MNSQKEKCTALAALHAQQDAWTIPNPWDVGSAKDLEKVGFKALATSSAAFAYTLGKADGQVSLNEKLAHCAAIANQTNIPLSVDFEDGFADDPKQVAANIQKLAATGVAGCSIEDYSREGKHVFDFNQAVERIQAATESVQSLDFPFQLVARAENLLRKHADLDDTIKRLQAYSAAGAHVLYAPGLSSLDEVKLVRQSTDRPLNVLAPFLPGVSVQDLGAAGANRISLGGALQHKVRAHLQALATEMLSSGKPS